MTCDQTEDNRIGKTMRKTFPCMVSWLGRKFRYLVMGCLATGVLETRAANVQYSEQEDGKQKLTAVVEPGDDWGKVAQGLARMVGKCLTDEQEALVVRELMRANCIQIETNAFGAATNTLSVGTSLETWSAYELAGYFSYLNDSQVLASSNIEVPGNRTIHADFVRYSGANGHTNCTGWYLASQGRIFINIKNITDMAEGGVQHRGHPPKCYWHGLFPGMDARDIIRCISAEVLYHEYIHTRMVSVIRSAAFKKRRAELTHDWGGDSYSVALEVASFLGQLYFSEDPRLYLGCLLQLAGKEDTDKTYASASSIVISLLVEKYGGRKSVLKMEASKRGHPLTDAEEADLKKKYTQGGYFKNAPDLTLTRELLWNVPRERLRKDIPRLFRDCFGTDLPDRKYFVVPDAVLPEKTKVPGDAAEKP